MSLAARSVLEASFHALPDPMTVFWAGRWWFESISLQRRVCELSVPKPPSRLRIMKLPRAILSGHQRAAVRFGSTAAVLGQINHLLNITSGHRPRSPELSRLTAVGLGIQERSYSFMHIEARAKSQACWKKGWGAASHDWHQRGPVLAGLCEGALRWRRIPASKRTREKLKAVIERN